MFIIMQRIITEVGERRKSGDGMMSSQRLLVRFEPRTWLQSDGFIAVRCAHFPTLIGDTASFSPSHQGRSFVADASSSSIRTFEGSSTPARKTANSVKSIAQPIRIRDTSPNQGRSPKAPPPSHKNSSKLSPRKCMYRRSLFESRDDILHRLTAAELCRKLLM